MTTATKHTFTPSFHTAEQLHGVYDITDLANETGVYSATPEFVRKHCGPIANRILDAVPTSYFEEAKDLGLFPNVDVRVHRLYPGDYPAYPGWHCDGQYRETFFSQPDPNLTKVANHIICSVSSSEHGVSNTQFWDGEPIELEHDEGESLTLWGKMDRDIRLRKRKQVYDTRDGEMVMFDSYTPHRVMPAAVRGWRLFFRMAMWYRPNLGNGGCVSRQEHVYKLCEGSGW